MYVCGESNVRHDSRVLEIKFGKTVPAETDASFAVRFILPSTDVEASQWRFRVLKQDTRETYITNDMKFEGFPLLRHIPFSIEPAQITPGANTRLVLFFDQTETLKSDGGVVKLELVAPPSYLFSAVCLSESELSNPTRIFQNCVGAANVATLVSIDPTLVKGTRLRSELMVKLPLQTPMANRWSLTIFLDDSASSFGQSETMGFEIIPMDVSFKGNNKLGKESSGYFTFKPNRRVQAGWQIHITPPVNQGYGVSCWGLRKISLPKLPKCMTVRTSDTLALEIPEGGELQGGFEYTVGVGVTNADRLIVDRVNLWSVVIYDQDGATQDSNHEVMGLKLGSMHIDVAERVMLQDRGRVEPGSEVQIRVSITVSKDIAAGAVTEFQLFPPKNFEIV